MTTYTKQDLVHIANQRWADIATRTNLPAYTCDQVSAMCAHVGDLLNSNTKQRWDEDHEENFDDPTLAQIDRLLGTFRRGLILAAAVSPANPNEHLLAIAAVGLHADARGIAALPQPDGSLLAAQIGDTASMSDTDHLAAILGGERLYHADGPSADADETTSNPTGEHVALWRIPAESAGDWAAWRERIDGAEPDNETLPTDGQRAALDELRALAGSR